VPESQIEQILVTAINQTLCDKDSFLATLQNNIETVLSQGNDQVLADVDKRLKKLQAELLKLATSNADYEKVGNEIYQLRDEKPDCRHGSFPAGAAHCPDRIRRAACPAAD
jgi:site-specific DNA recombinase